MLPDWSQLPELSKIENFPFGMMKYLGTDYCNAQINFFKTLEGFKHLPEDDQVALIRESAYEIFLTRIMHFANKETTLFALKVM